MRYYVEILSHRQGIKLFIGEEDLNVIEIWIWKNLEDSIKREIDKEKEDEAKITNIEEELKNVSDIK